MKVIIIPFIVAFIAQALKLATNKIRGDFTWYHILASYGGMPSSHSAMVASLATVCALKAGVSSVFFAIALVFAAIILRDVLAFRTYIGKQNRVLNQLQEKMELKEKIVLQEKVGHTIWEVLVGCLLGVGLSLLLYYIWP